MSGDEPREAAHGEDEEGKCLLFVGIGECKQISSDSANFFDISWKDPILRVSIGWYRRTYIYRHQSNGAMHSSSCSVSVRNLL